MSSLLIDFVEWENEADLSADTLYLEGTVIEGSLAGDRSGARCDACGDQGGRGVGAGVGVGW